MPAWKYSWLTVLTQHSIQPISPPDMAACDSRPLSGLRTLNACMKMSVQVHQCWWLAGQMVGLTKKTENLPAQKPGITTSTGPQVSTPPPFVLHLPLVHVPTNTMQFPQPVAFQLISHHADSQHLTMGSNELTVLQRASCVTGQ